MPLTHVWMRKGKPDAYRRAILDSIHLAMCETFDVPADNEFATIAEHDAVNFHCSGSYLGIRRTDEALFIQITANNTRSVEQKKALFRAVAERLAAAPGVRREDVFINLVEVAKENWSLGLGLAQYG